MNHIRHGYIFFIIACGIYMVWWALNYYPDSPFADFASDQTAAAIWIGMFLAVFVSAFTGFLFMVYGLMMLDRERRLFHVLPVFTICLAANFLLPILIRHIRPITSDIYLIIWWAFLEMCMANNMYGTDQLDIRNARHALIRIAIYTAVSLFIYIIYPFPPEYIRFWLGAVPIGLYAVDMWMLAEKMKTK